MRMLQFLFRAKLILTDEEVISLCAHHVLDHDCRSLVFGMSSRKTALGIGHCCFNASNESANFVCKALYDGMEATTCPAVKNLKHPSFFRKEEFFDLVDGEFIKVTPSQWIG